jgi:adsorption protein B
MIGQILVEQGALDESVLLQRLNDKPSGMRIGTWLVHSGTISAVELAQGLAQQAGVSYRQIVADDLSPELMARVPAPVALHYAVLPIALERDRLTLASESTLSPITLAALKRKLGLSIDYVIVPIGQVTVGLRRWYARLRQTEPRDVLAEAIREGRLDSSRAQEAWQRYESHQILLGEVLQSLGRIDTAAFSAILLQHAQTEEPLGEFLVSRGILSQEVLDLAITRQKEIQCSMSQVIEQLSGDQSLQATTVSA